MDGSTSRCDPAQADHPWRQLEYDFEGTSPQINKGINSCYNYTFGYAAFAAKAVLEPLIPNNEGAYRPITMKAPEALSSIPPDPRRVTAAAVSDT